MRVGSRLKDGWLTGATNGGLGGNPPAGTPGFAPGTGTRSRTPLGWTRARFVRLAWSIDAGRPVERPAVVACWYAGRCP